MKTALTVYSHNFCTRGCSFEKTFLHAKKTKFYANKMDVGAPHANCIENNHMKILFVIIFCRSEQKNRPRVG